jgi:UDP-N-acetyl-D-mannosaminuronic acid dehydrogenase
MSPQDLLEKVRRGDYTLGVIGLGRVGLPLALAFAVRGIHVIGVDVDERHVARVGEGVMPFKEDGGQEALQQALVSGRLEVGADYAALERADAIFITVGTTLDNQFRPDYSALRSALAGLGEVLRPVQLIMLRSTVAPGTLTKLVAPWLERTLHLKVGRDVLLASTPERIAAGRALQELPQLPEVVGGMDELSSQVAAEVLRTLNPQKRVFITSPTGAELAKLFTNVYRYVTFALANEFALLCEVHGEDAHEIIRISNQDYPRGGIPMPGPCGGPCLAKDGYFLVEDITFPDFILTAWKLNESIPAYVVRRLKHKLQERRQGLRSARVAVLGMGFKADIDDVRQSPAVRLAELLRAEGAEVVVTDPYHETPDLPAALRDADAVVLATNHSAYRSMEFLDILQDRQPRPILVDCWGVWDEAVARERGFDIIVFGKGDGR